MENKEWICTYCGGKEYIRGKQGGYANIFIGNVFSCKESPVEHEICMACGSIVRSYVTKLDKLKTK